jgi:hypothetical protein
MTFANDYSIWILLIGFAVMSLNSFVRPSMVTAQFDTPTLSTAYRYEVRAIYGWFGILMAGSQLGALFNPALRSGMVCRRLVSWIAYKKFINSLGSTKLLVSMGRRSPNLLITILNY